MTSALLTSDYSNSQDNIDLIPLLEKFSKFFKFHENHKSFLRNLKPSSLEKLNSIYNKQEDMSNIENWQDKVRKALQSVDADFPFESILRKTSKGQVLETKELIKTHQLLLALHPLQKNIKSELFKSFDVNSVNKCFKNFNKEAELLFDFKSQTLITYKHGKLKVLDKKIQETTKELRIKLSKISSNWANDELLQQNEYDVLEDKFVLPIRSDRFNGQLGRIIYRSNSGNTLFVEPFALRQLTNVIEELKAELEREIYKLLKFLSEELYKNYELISEIFFYIRDIDLCFGRLSCAIQHQLTRPKLNTESHVEIEGIFHPLIQEPVTNDIKIKKGDRGLLISGPNTGGKTVLLKSLCLCMVLPHLGFYVPADSADINYSEDIFFISHDNQSLLDGLSSFSSEAINYLEVIKYLKPNSVIFIDEIFNSTSSLEASELAVALIRQITHLGCQVFISSHHENLKQWVFNDSIVKSGHMGFTKGTNRPTYIFHSGSPGKSFAKEVFLGLEEQTFETPLITRWLGQQSDKTVNLDQKIQDLDQLREDSLKQKEKFQKLQKELELQREQVKNLLEIEKKKLESQFEKRWQKIKKETLDLRDKIKRGEVKNILKVSESLNSTKTKHSSDSDVEVQIKGIVKESFNIGDLVVIKGLNKEGKILKISKNKAQVEAGTIKSWVNLNQLLGSQNKKNNSREGRVSVHIQKSKEGRGMILDARGLRREEFLNRAEGHILDVLNGDLPFVDIIHGFGDGVLKKSLYELLKKYSELSYGFVEGNMGTTRIELMN